jgi:hypothetical protein
MGYTVEEIQSILEPVFKEHKTIRAILFGSYAKGCAKENSDIDILVDSGLKGLAFFGLLNDVTEALSKDVDLFDYQQFSPESTMFKEIHENGIIIYERGSHG